MPTSRTKFGILSPKIVLAETGTKITGATTAPSLHPPKKGVQYKILLLQYRTPSLAGRAT